MKIITIILSMIFLFSVSTCSATERIYDKNFRVQGYVKDEKIYSKDWKVKYYIHDGKIYSRTGKVVGYVKNSKED